MKKVGMLESGMLEGNRLDCVPSPSMGEGRERVNEILESETKNKFKNNEPRKARRRSLKQVKEKQGIGYREAG